MNPSLLCILVVYAQICQGYRARRSIPEAHDELRSSIYTTESLDLIEEIDENIDSPLSLGVIEEAYDSKTIDQTDMDEREAHLAALNTVVAAGRGIKHLVKSIGKVATVKAVIANATGSETVEEIDENTDSPLSLGVIEEANDSKTIDQTDMDEREAHLGALKTVIAAGKGIKHVTKHVVEDISKVAQVKKVIAEATVDALGEGVKKVAQKIDDVALGVVSAGTGIKNTVSEATVDALGEGVVIAEATVDALGDGVKKVAKKIDDVALGVVAAGTGFKNTVSEIIKRDVYGVTEGSQSQCNCGNQCNCGKQCACRSAKSCNCGGRCTCGH